MHQVTESTIQDLIDRSIAFTHRAFVALRKLGKFNYADSSYIFGDNWAENALTTVTITLLQRDGRSNSGRITDKEGNIAELTTVAEGPYSYSINNTAVYLRIPYFMLNFVAGFKDLMNLIDDPDAHNRLCRYCDESYRKMMNGTMSESMQDFRDAFWLLGTAPSECLEPSYIPELRRLADNLRCLYDDTFHEASSLFRSHQPLWHMREEARIRFGIYDPLPDAVKAMLDPAKTVAIFPHLSIKASNAGMIAYTQNTTHGVMDRQSVMRAGRFLRQFALDGVSDEDVKQMAAHVASTLSSQFKHSNQREDYANVYINGPSSCMAYDETGKEFHRLKVDDVFVHPTEVYAHPDNDLEIVWCEVQDNIVARTIVNKKRMQYPRIYAKESVGNAEQRLRGYLEDLGYAPHDLALTGQKLLRISPTKHPSAIICPYIDSSNLGVEVYDDHLVTGGGYNANHETGCLNDYDVNGSGDHWQCDCCEEHFDEDDSRYTDYAGDPICENCIDQYTLAYCTDSQENRYVPEDYDGLYKLVNVRRGSLRHYTHIYINNSGRDLNYHDLVELTSDHYDDSSVALDEDCVQLDDGDYILTNDLDDHDLFFNQDDDTACHIREWAIVVDEDGDPALTRTNDIDEDLFEHSPRETDSTYPMLKVYTEIPVTQDEEAA